MHVPFTKMHGLGNDFIVLDRPPGLALPDAAGWQRLSNRHTGIGFDQAMVVEAPRAPGQAAWYRIFNADGGEVEQCGNGARCVARFLALAGRAGERFEMASPGGPVQARVLADGRVSVDLGVPDFTPAALPFVVSTEADSYELAVAGESVRIGAVSMGNPHAVLRVEDVTSAPVTRLGPALQADARFPRQVNVGFMQVLDAGHVKLRVFERGAGETLACGTGACAAVAVGRRWGLLAHEVEVQAPGGRLVVHWEGPGHGAWLTGPAEVAFTGQVDI